MIIMLKMIIGKKNCCTNKTFKQLLENFGIPLINCEISLVLAWSEKFFLVDIITHAAIAAQEYNPERQAINAPTYATLKITDTKLYVPVVTWSSQLKMIINFWSN